MPSFHWNDPAARFFLDRYPSWADGLAQWRQATTAWATAPTLAPLQSRLMPRIFVSHRQSDLDRAERIAWLADRVGFEYWLDIHDPLVAQLQKAGAMTSEQQAIAIATIIEMALHNCTHVLAVVSDHATGSAWIPYEYGRIPRTSPPPAGCWRAKNLTTFPEYLHLGVVTNDELELTTWFTSEIGAWSVKHGIPVSVPAGNWHGPIPPPLR